MLVQRLRLVRGVWLTPEECHVYSSWTFEVPHSLGSAMFLWARILIRLLSVSFSALVEVLEHRTPKESVGLMSCKRLDQ